MNWIDGAVLSMGVGVSLVGWRVGFVRALLLAVGTALGIYVASRLYLRVAPIFTFVDTSYARVIAFLLIFVVILAAAVGTTIVLKAVADRMQVGWVDKAVGVTLGVLVALAFGSAVLALLLNTSSFGVGKTIQESALGSFLADRFDVVLRVLRLLPRHFSA